MDESLLNIREAAEYLGVGERRIKELVDAGRIPAYRIGGTFLRFKKSQLAAAKKQLAVAKRPLYEKRKQVAPATSTDEISESAHSVLDGVKDFFYFNDFYILSIVVIFIAVALMIAT